MRRRSQSPGPSLGVVHAGGYCTHGTAARARHCPTALLADEKVILKTQTLGSVNQLGMIDQRAGAGECVVSIQSDYRVSASTMMEYLLTEHAYAREISNLPDEPIDRLRRMLNEAVKQCIAPQDVYDAITRGFEATVGASIPSPPIAHGFDEAPSDLQVLQEGPIKKGPLESGL